MPTAPAYEIPIHQYTVPKLYISAGVPSRVIADMKLASKDMETGIKFIFPPARRKFLVLPLLRSLMAKKNPIHVETTKVAEKIT